jgi:hypothetical protein
MGPESGSVVSDLGLIGEPKDVTSSMASPLVAVAEPGAVSSGNMPTGEPKDVTQSVVAPAQDVSSFFSDPKAIATAKITALSGPLNIPPYAIQTMARQDPNAFANWNSGLDYAEKQREIDALSFKQALGDKTPATDAKIKKLQAEQAAEPKANFVQGLISGAGEQGAAGLRSAGMFALGILSWPYRKAAQALGLHNLADKQTEMLSQIGSDFGLSPERTKAITENPVTGLGETAKESTAGITGPTYRSLVDAGVNPDVASSASFVIGGALTALQAVPAGRLLPGAQRIGEEAFKDAVVQLAKNGSLTSLAKLWGTRVATIGVEQVAIGMANATTNVLGQEWAKQYSNKVNQQPIFMTPSMPTPKGLVSPGNINLNNRPNVVINKQALHEGVTEDQEIATVRSMSFGEGGKEILVPTVSDDGRIMTDDQAIQQYHKTGKMLGIFTTPKEADIYAEQLHEDQANRKIIPATPFADLAKDILTQAGEQAAVGTAIGGITAAREMKPTYEMGVKLRDWVDNVRAARARNVTEPETVIPQKALPLPSEPIEQARNLLEKAPEERDPQAVEETQAKLDESVKAITANPTPETVPQAIEAAKASDAIETTKNKFSIQQDEGLSGRPVSLRPQNERGKMEQPLESATRIESNQLDLRHSSDNSEGNQPPSKKLAKYGMVYADGPEGGYYENADYSIVMNSDAINIMADQKTILDHLNNPQGGVSESEIREWKEKQGYEAMTNEQIAEGFAIEKLGETSAWDDPSNAEMLWKIMGEPDSIDFPVGAIVFDNFSERQISQRSIQSGQPSYIEQSVKQGVPVDDASVLPIKDPWAISEMEHRMDVRNTAIEMNDAGDIDDAESFAAEMKLTELPGQEKPEAWYKNQWDNMERQRTYVENAKNDEFLTSLDKNSLQETLRAIAEYPEAEIGKVLEPWIEKAQGGMSNSDFQSFVAEAVKNPGKWRRAIERALNQNEYQEQHDRFVQSIASKVTKQSATNELLTKYADRRVGELTTSADSEEQKAAQAVSKLMKAAMKEPGSSIAYDSRVKIQELQNTVSMESGTHLRDVRDRLRTYYESHPETPPDEATTELLNQKLSGDMKVKELQSLADQIDAERQIGKTVQAIKQMKERAFIEDTKNRLMNDIQTRAGWKEPATSEPITAPKGLEAFEKPKGVGSRQFEKSRKGNVPQKFQAQTLSPLRIFRTLGPTGERIWKAENDARSAEYEANDKIQEPAKVKARALGITGHNLAKILKTKDGLEYTVDEVISMQWAHGNPDSRDTLIHGNNITEVQYQELVDQLKPNEKEWGDYIQSVFGRDNFDRVSKAYVEETNSPPPPQVENYFPIRIRDRIYDSPTSEIVQDMNGRTGIRAATPNKRFMKSRQNINPEHRQPMALGATKIFFEQVAKQEHYINTWQTAQRMRKIFTDPKVRGQIAQSYGDDWNKAIDSAITAFANPNALKTTTPMDRLSAATRSALTSSALVGNLPVFAYHLTGPLLYLGDTGPHHILSSVGQWMLHPKDVYNEVYDNAPIIKHMSGDPVLEEIRNSNPAVHKQIKDTINRVGFQPFEWIWSWIRVVGAKAVHDADIGAGFSERDAWDHAVTACQRVQPTGSSADVPMMYHAASTKAFLVLSRQINQYWNMMSSDIPQALAQGKLKEALGTMAALAITGMTVGMVKSKGMPKDAKEAATWLADQFITAIPFVGDEIAPLLTGKGYSGGASLIPAASQIGGDVKNLLTKRQSQSAKIDSAIKVAIDASRVIGGPAVFLSRLYGFIKTGDPWEFMGGSNK